MAERNARRGGGLGTIKAWSEARDRFPGLSTPVDIVFVIDGTASMQSLLDEVKERALSMYQEIVDGLEDKNRILEKLRIKVLIFRDIYVDTNAFEESEFFTLPEEAEKLRAFMEQIRAAGGGGGAKSALEALHRAIHVKWQEVPADKRHRRVIIVMTDAPAHPLDDPRREGEDRYPQDVPRSLSELQYEWEEYAYPHYCRLAIIAPNCWPWTELSMWSAVHFLPVQPGLGVDGDIVNTLIPFISGCI